MTIFAKLTVSWFARVREKRSGLPRARNLSGFLSKAGAFLSGFIFFRRPCLSRQAGQEVIAHQAPFFLSLPSLLPARSAPLSRRAAPPPCPFCPPAKLAPRSSPAKFASPLPVLHLFPNALPPCPLFASARFCPLCQARFPFACFAPCQAC